MFSCIALFVFLKDAVITGGNYVIATLCMKLDKAIDRGALWEWILYLTTLECRSFVFKERSCFKSLYQAIQVVREVCVMVCLLKHRYHTSESDP